MLSDQTNKRPISNLISESRNDSSIAAFWCQLLVLWTTTTNVCLYFLIRWTEHLYNNGRDSCYWFADSKISHSHSINWCCSTHALTLTHYHTQKPNFIPLQCQNYNQKSNFQFYCYTRCVRFTAHNNNNQATNVGKKLIKREYKMYIYVRVCVKDLHAKRKISPAFYSNTKILSSCNQNQLIFISLPSSFSLLVFFFHSKLMTNASNVMGKKAYNTK